MTERLSYAQVMAVVAEPEQSERSVHAWRSGIALAALVVLLLALIIFVLPLFRFARDGVENACAEKAPTQKAEIASADLSFVPLGWECRTAEGEVIVRLAPR